MVLGKDLGGVFFGKIVERFECCWRSNFLSVRQLMGLELDNSGEEGRGRGQGEGIVDSSETIQILEENKERKEIKTL